MQETKHLGKLLLPILRKSAISAGRSARGRSLFEVRKIIGGTDN
jgi:hypothetical protein